MGYEIRALTTMPEFREHARLQRQVWGSDSVDVPENLLAAGARHGAIVLGGYEADRMVGLLFGFPALSGGRTHHHSHMLGVLPEHRRRGLGLALKLRQRELVREQGLDLITWTVDPLETSNNLLNFGRLGVVCDTYIVNAYGEMDDKLNRGLPSDRLEVEWRVAASETRRGDVAPPSAALLGGVEIRPDGLLAPRRAGSLSGDRAVVEAPRDFRAIRATDPALALRWRLHLRELFTESFDRGWALVGCEAGDGIARYTLARDCPAPAGA
jgi:predicted GNAT superfamily acetyltransferase